ncbi:MAG: S8 family serine peptidase, partial [Vallitalea sp.]|nr:S8 family serine peptidase [Vallitalea sp.]
MKKIITFLLIFAIMTTSIFAQSIPVNAKVKDRSNKKTEVKNKKRVIVKYKDNGGMRAFGVQEENKKLSKLKKMKYSKVDIYEVDEEENIDSLVEELNNDEQVLYAQVDHPLTIFDEPLFEQQWALRNSGQDIEKVAGITGIDIELIKAWNITKGEESIVVGVLDTGVDISHTDLGKNIFVNTNEIPYNKIDDDGNGYIDDVLGWDFANDDETVFDSVKYDTHGTHIAGIIAARNNEEGVTGVAPSVKILPLKFINNKVGYTSDAIEAIEYAKQMGVKIINCSFGADKQNPALYDAMKNSDILFVCASGNSGNSTEVEKIYPACFDLPNVISVAAVDNKGQLANFSNYGPDIDIAAPGVNIISTLPEGKYGYMSGTSFAAPFVTGSAALIKSKYFDMTSSEVIGRIEKSVNPLESLNNHVKTSGLINTFAALSYNNNDIDNSANVDEDNDSNSEDKDDIDNEDIALSIQAVSVSASLKEMIHYGEEGINPAIGNFSKSVTDMTTDTPGFKINISRTYNSKDTKKSMMGIGWTFGLEGNIKQDTNNSSLWVVKLPNGSAEVFLRNSNGTYTANDSRSTLEKIFNNTHVLKTKDQYSYGFNKDGYLTYMEDRNGNRITIDVDDKGNIKKLTDQNGHYYTVTYNAKGLISKIEDPINRITRYYYNEEDRLIKVTDPRGNDTKYDYDNGLLVKTTDREGKAFEEIVYEKQSGNNKNKVVEYTNRKGRTNRYFYDTANKTTTIIDDNSREINKWYDSAYYIIKSQDTEGRQTTIEYFLDSSNHNKFGEEKKITDRYGNVTSYERDDKGNITKKINNDGSFCTYKYDYKNNLIEEKDESGRRIFYKYDSRSINIVDEIRPVNGTDDYVNDDQSKLFTHKKYTYFTYAELQQMGAKVKGLLKSTIDGEGHTTVYTYDKNGFIQSVTDPAGNKTKKTYNDIGWLVDETTPSGYKTKYFYDNNGNIEKIVSHKGETTRMIYDKENRNIQTIAPNNYQEQLDGLNFKTPEHIYVDGSGFVSTYDDKGNIVSETDEENNTTEYTYDIYGNKITQKRPNGSIYVYKYDTMNRLTKLLFKNDKDDKETLLEEYIYKILSDGKQYETVKTYFDDTNYAESSLIKDYAGRTVEEIKADGGTIKYVYNKNGTIKSKEDPNHAITYYKYDGLNRLSQEWSPIENDTFAYKEYVYDKTGRVIEEKVGKDKVDYNEIPASDRFSTVTKAYYSNGNLQTETNSSGSKVEYEYDGNGNIIKQTLYEDKDTTRNTLYKYDHRGNIVQKKDYIRAGDLYNNDFANDDEVERVTTYQYDKNNNLIKETSPQNITTSYRYDKLNRQVRAYYKRMDEHDLPALIATITTYNSIGKIKTITDPNGNTTEYEYNPMGHLVKTKQKVTIESNQTEIINQYAYDRAGRKTVEISPENYDKDKTISEMNRIKYIYDPMNRLIAKQEIQKKTGEDTYITTIKKAFQYDNNGNKIKELDGEGYARGSGDNIKDHIITGYGTKYTYNLANQMVTIQDAESQDRNLDFTIKYSYDTMGRKSAETYCDGTIKKYYYDDNSNITT